MFLNIDIMSQKKKTLKGFATIKIMGLIYIFPLVALKYAKFRDILSCEAYALKCWLGYFYTL